MTIGVCLRDLHPQRKELHHPAFVYLHKLAIFGGKDERRWMSEIHESEVPVRSHFTVKHRRNLLGVRLFTPAERVAGRDRQREPQIDPLKQLWRRFPSVIEL